MAEGTRRREHTQPQGISERGNPRDEEVAQLKKEVADLRETLDFSPGLKSAEILKKSDGLLCGKKSPRAAYQFMSAHNAKL